MLKTLAMIFGVVFLLAGVLGFVPALTPDGTLFGLEVNAAHNVIHILTGLLGLWWGMTEAGGRRFFQVIGVVYAVVALLGFFYGDNDLLGFIAHNMADTYFHLVVAIIALVLGFGMKRRDAGMGGGM